MHCISLAAGLAIDGIISHINFTVYLQTLAMYTKDDDSTANDTTSLLSACQLAMTKVEHAAGN